jgi:RNA-directed DNA polymerase
MITEQQHIEKIRASFKEMQTKEDLLRLLNEAKVVIYGEKAVPFEIKQFTWYSNHKSGQKRYRRFVIRKKSGGKRHINAPVKGLKQLQRALAFVLQCVFEPHKAATGFVWNKSIVDNAKLHENSRYVYNLDLKDFFSSIDQARVWKCLQLPPFNLKSDTISFKEFKNLLPGEIKSEENKDLKGLRVGFREKIVKTAKGVEKHLYPYPVLETEGDRSKLANMIAAICCTEMEVERMNEQGEWVTLKKNVLPQGAPTSPVLSNVVCQRLDFLLSGVAKRFGLRYSRYADDITFSSMHNMYQSDSEFIIELHKIILKQGFHIKEGKTRLQKEGHRQEVTGLLVNEKVNVKKRYIKQLRMWLYYWEKYGYEKAEQLFRKDYIADKGHVNKGLPNMQNVIKGKLDYLKMVKGENNALYLKLMERFESIKEKIDPVNNILDIWETQGIDKAMDLYFSENTE